MSSEFIKPQINDPLRNDNFNQIVKKFEEEQKKDSMIQNVADTNTSTQNFLKDIEQPTKGGRKKSLRKTNRKRKTRRRRTNRRR